MAGLKVVWHEPATGMFGDTVEWYKSEMGLTAARRFRDGILNAVRLLALQPQIGRRVEIPEYRCDYELRIFVEHPNHLILYYVDGLTLHIADIFAARMAQKFIWI